MTAPPPAGTYRLQLRGGVDLHDAADLVPYLARLGVSHLYLSPVAEARAGSDHGYDVLDPRRVDPALGGQDAWDDLVRVARQHGIGVVVDIVPDHLAAHADNPWWRDVLRHGPASPHAHWFDVDWDAPSLPGRVLLPLLHRPLPESVAGGAVRFVLREEVEVEVADQRLPLDPATYALLLDGVDEARALVEAARALPRRARGEERVAPAVRVLEDVRQRLGTVVAGGRTRYVHGSGLRDAVQARVDHLNSPDGRGHTLLLLDAQAYALAPWREAPRRIRHRRFFDINDLVGLRPHHPDAFEALHEWLLREAEAGNVAGVRVDHVDGLGDPTAYLQRLRAALPVGVSVFVEKITEPDEPLPDWPVDGTTGYDAMAHVDALQVDPDGLRRLSEAHAEATGRPPFPDVARRAARHVMEHLFRGILDDLARRLRLALDGTDEQDGALREAVAAVTAALPVYRTYTRDTVRPEDREVLERTLAAARDEAPGAALDALAGVLLEPRTDAQRAWVHRWQQWSPAVHAKAVEDTALYRAATLLSLNEVGQDPDRPPIGTAAFLRFATARAVGPAGLTATTTHDTKMSEDVRARLHVLSQRPEACVETHKRLLHRVPPKTLDGQPVPGPAMAWRLHQTLLGIWPVEGDLYDRRKRLRDHVVKASREAKVRTDWLEPDERYEAALLDHVDRLVAAAAADDGFLRLAREVAEHGMVASLAAVVLRHALPGTPDLYQGMESWRFLLVDPDNRRRVDFPRLREALAGLDRGRADPAALFASWHDGRVKLHVTAACLRHRRDHAAAYAGGLEPCPVEGGDAEAEERAVAFLRGSGADRVLAVVPRLSAAWSDGVPVGSAWGDAVVRLPPGAPAAWHDALTGRTLHAEDGAMPLRSLLALLPVALLNASP